MNREQWLAEMAKKMAPVFEAAGKPLPTNIRYSCGFTSRKAAIGQCWYPEGSADGHAEIFIVPGKDDPIEVAGILLHELVHAALGAGHGHGKEFKKLALAVGLQGPMKSASPTNETTIALKWMIDEVGPYPHGRLAAGGLIKVKATGTDPLINLRCPHCDYFAKVKPSDMARGRLRCPDDGEMLLTKEERKLYGDEG